MSNVTMYSKITCPYCVLAEQLLKRKRVTEINKIAIDNDPAELELMIARTGRRSVPQIFVGDEFVGGYDDLVAFERAGKLDLLLNR